VPGHAPTGCRAGRSPQPSPIAGRQQPPNAAGRPCRAEWSRPERRRPGPPRPTSPPPRRFAHVGRPRPGDRQPWRACRARPRSRPGGPADGSKGPRMGSRATDPRRCNASVGGAARDERIGGERRRAAPADHLSIFSDSSSPHNVRMARIDPPEEWADGIRGRQGIPNLFFSQRAFRTANPVQSLLKYPKTSTSLRQSSIRRAHSSSSRLE
jgi:hypothetical protein